MYENLVVNTNCWTLWATCPFLPKTNMRIFLPWRNTLLYSSQVQYRDSDFCFQTHQQMWSLLQCGIGANVEVYCQKNQTCCIRLHFLDCAIANLFMILVVFISNRTSCS